MSAERPAGLERTGPTGIGAFACAIAFLLPTAFSPSTESVFWAPKWALLLPLLGVGLPRLWSLARHPSVHRTSARLAIALLAAAALSTLWSRSTWMAVLGVYGFGTGLVFVGAAIAAWAVGASLSETDRSRLGRAVIAAGVVTAVVCVLEVTIDLRAFELGLYGGRAIGLQGNPVHVGPPVMAAFALLVAPFARRPLIVALPLVLLVVAVQAGGSRSAFLALLVVVAWAVTRLTWPLRALLVVVVVVGLVGGDALVGLRGGTSISGRVAVSAAGEGFGGRVEQWSLTRHAVAERPLLGWGPGSFRTATSQDRTVALARAFGADVISADAHNIVVEVLVTLGFLGVALASAFLGSCARRARGAFAAASAAALVVGLLQPMYPGTTVPAMLALGAAGPLVAGDAVHRVVRGGWILAVAGGAAAVAFLAGQVLLREARLDFDPGTARLAEAVAPPWPLPSQVRGRIATFEARTRANDPDLLAEALRHHRRATARDPSDPFVLEALADAYAASGRLAEAEQTYLTALVQNPPSVSLRNALGVLAVARGREAEARRWYRESASIEPGQLDVEQQLDRPRRDPAER